jgi:hypothetical protein
MSDDLTLDLIVTNGNSVCIECPELQTYYQIPSIAHFCNLFRNFIDLPDFDYEVRLRDHHFDHQLIHLFPE